MFRFRRRRSQRVRRPGIFARWALALRHLFHGWRNDVLSSTRDRADESTREFRPRTEGATRLDYLFEP